MVVISSSFRGGVGKVFSSKCNVNKSNRGKTGRWRCGGRKVKKMEGRGREEEEGASGGTAEVDTNEEPL